MLSLVLFLLLLWHIQYDHSDDDWASWETEEEDYDEDPDLEERGFGVEHKQQPNIVFILVDDWGTQMIHLCRCDSKLSTILILSYYTRLE